MLLYLYGRAASKLPAALGPRDMKKVISLTWRGALQSVQQASWPSFRDSGHANLSKGESGAMSTTAIVILVAIGLVLLMRLNDREDASVRGSSVAGYIAAVGVLLGITVLFVRACQGTF
jgi:hypothetical protein